MHFAMHILTSFDGTCGIVYEPFAGSGTTIIAAERLGRRCFAMEIDPVYVDVAVKRWEDFTGKKAQKVTCNEKTPATAGANEEEK
ncbi:MAG: DNA methyltransferase [Phycisphaerae bacterium]|nr:DNA methyltransferase [Phycisphaerae bacterium]